MARHLRRGRLTWWCGACGVRGWTRGSLGAVRADNRDGGGFVKSMIRQRFLRSGAGRGVCLGHGYGLARDPGGAVASVPARVLSLAGLF